MNRLVVFTILMIGISGASAAEGPASNAAVEAVAERKPDALDRFETELRADPDNLHLGAEYRQAVIESEAYDRCLDFFEELTRLHPASPNLLLNYGYAHVDKIPTEGAITGVILANTALTHFTTAIELSESWLARYTRGNSYLYWPTIFGRTRQGIADLERAVELSGQVEKRPFHAHAYAALGDGYWRLGEYEKMRDVWRTGLELFPGDPDLQELEAFYEEHFAMTTRVETDLRELLVTKDDS
jgi:tetratricopeptide (TPR) repeat protein